VEQGKAAKVSTDTCFRLIGESGRIYPTAEIFWCLSDHKFRGSLFFCHYVFL